LATVVLAYRNLTSQYTIPRKIALARIIVLARIISEIASILSIKSVFEFWY